MKPRSSISRCGAAAALAMLLAGGASAHEVHPAYLQLQQTGPESYDLLWKVPARGEDLRLGLYVELPERCANLTEPRGVFAGGGFTERWSAKCTGGLAGDAIRIAGLSRSAADVLVRVERLDGTAQDARLTAASPSFVLEAASSRTRVASTYLKLGIEHILLGVDHLLFVLALILLVKGWSRLVGTITAFTVAHSITLAAATLGWVQVPGPPVEACIALSILLVAVELVRAHDRFSFVLRWPWLMAFAFGLLHGFGFAGALREIGLPQHAIPLALFFFNVGVELGQLAFITVVLGIFSLAKRIKLAAACERYARPAAPYAIGSLASFWFFDRLAGFWT